MSDMRVALNVLEAIGLHRLPKFVKHNGEDRDLYTILPFVNGREIGLVIANEQTDKACAVAESRNSDDIVVFYGRYDYGDDKTSATTDFELHAFPQPVYAPRENGNVEIEYFGSTEVRNAAKYIVKCLGIGKPVKFKEYTQVPKQESGYPLWAPLSPKFANQINTYINEMSEKIYGEK